ncbi:class I SAM-dependent methyltransferase [Halanaerobium sp. ST460_2HS_T2]|uniref:class I SAM-dependent methyltransferase n=1 Tax=Halanaerobium sp. ST460_2HS_T2 TaxID=2183914 RepID=UPI000DF28791|nr:class I SAM-dependent methyltransferase [Halanaerobium sp. ST460_2HS_T2]RCW52114.1 methyltransferase family protein [Halanaerobium sp. ST460_2HS_T2]
MNINKLISLSQKPKLFERSKTAFWDDSHISKKMLEAHLNPDSNAASRKISIIDRSVKWLNKEIFLNKNIEILDLGCGPGLYASRLAESGYSVTGIDYSERSINYAKKQIKENDLNIEYIYQNYLTIDFESEFDVIMLIFCDLGALTNKERDILLDKVYRALKPGGIFIFDVFTDKNRSKDLLDKSWEVKNGGFWSEKTYLALKESFFYAEADTFLDQTLVITEEDEIRTYRIFNHFYTKESITNLLNKFGFANHSYYSDMMGSDYSKESETLAVVTKKLK